MMNTGIFIAVGVCVLSAFIYLGIHIAGTIKLARSQDTEPISRLAIAAWAISFASGFMGPCVILFNVAAIVMGVMVLRADPTERSRLCARTAIAAGATITVMALLMLAIIIPSLPS